MSADEQGTRPQKSTIELRSHLLVGLAIVLLLLQLLFPSRAWLIPLCAVAGIALSAYLWARSLARSTRMARSLRYTWAQVGDLLEEEFVLENSGRWPVLWAEVEDRSTLPGYAAGQVVAVSAGGTYRWQVSGVCRRRGVFRLGPWTARMRDPFGIFVVTQVYDQSYDLVVVPPIAELPLSAPPQGVAAGRAVARRSATDLTLNVSGTRRYAAGDPVRRIHWPSTARHRTLISKTFDEEISGDLWIVLDLEADVQAGEGEESTEEYAVILAASLADRLLRENRAVGLVAYGAEETYLIPQRGEGHLWKLLQALAPVQARGHFSLATVLGEMHPVLGRRASVVVITPSPEPAWVEAFGPLVRQGAAPMVILLDPSSFGGTGDLAAVRDMLTRLGIPAWVIAQGFPFQAPSYAYRPAGTWAFRTTATGRVIVTQRPREAVP